MGLFLAFNLKLTFCFVLFYMLYKTVLSRNTFYEINRRVLIFAYLLIVFIPLIDVPLFKLPARQSTDIYLFISSYEQFFVSPSPVQIKWTDIIVSVYMAGILFFSLRYLYFTAKIIRILLQGEKVRTSSNEKVIIVNQSVAPFAWMKYVVISRADFTDNGAAIIAHESAHIARGHFVDLFIADIFAIIQWYNPFIWLMKNELKDIHEFEADHTVLDSGFNRKQYQLLLIKKAVGSQRFNSMTNSLNHSKLNKRITMMLKEKSSRWAKMKYLTVLPLIAFALAVFARPEISSNLDKISEVKVSELSSKIETKIENFSAQPEKKVEMRPVEVIEKDTLSARREKIMNDLLRFLEQKRLETKDGDPARFFIDDRIKHLKSQMEEMQKRLDSEEWKSQVKKFELSQEAQEKVQKQMEEMQKRFESEEWKNHVKKIELSPEAREKFQKQMEELKKNFDSEKWQNLKKFKFSPEAQEELLKHFDSEQWKSLFKSLEKFQKYLESEEGQNQLKQNQLKKFQFDLSPERQFNFEGDTVITVQ